MIAGIRTGYGNLRQPTATKPAETCVIREPLASLPTYWVSLLSVAQRGKTQKVPKVPVGSRRPLYLWPQFAYGNVGGCRRFPFPLYLLAPVASASAADERP